LHAWSYMGHGTLLSPPSPQLISHSLHVHFWSNKNNALVLQCYKLVLPLCPSHTTEPDTEQFYVTWCLESYPCDQSSLPGAISLSNITESPSRDERSTAFPRAPLKERACHQLTSPLQMPIESLTRPRETLLSPNSASWLNILPSGCQWTKLRKRTEADCIE